MIVFDLLCDQGHGFEGWFGSTADFTDQQDRGLLLCPQCGSPEVHKAPMAPAVPRKGNQQPQHQITNVDAPFGSEPAQPQQVSNAPLTPEVAKAMAMLAEAQAKALKNSKWVGKDFAEQSRAMHYGERDHEPIHGEASLEDARDLLDEGVAIAPLPLPVSPPDELN